MSKETVKQYIRNQYIGKEQCQFLPQMNQQDSLAHSSLKGCFMAISRCNVHTDPSRIETTQQGSLLFPLILSWTGVWFTGKQVVVEHIFVLHGRVLGVGTLFFIPFRSFPSAYGYSLSPVVSWTLRFQGRQGYLHPFPCWTRQSGSSYESSGTANRKRTFSVYPTCHQPP